MQQQISVVTLATEDLERSKRFYVEGFGWKPVFENEEIAFYQMNGLVLATWLQSKLADDMHRDDLRKPGAFALAHNVPSIMAVQDLMAKLAANGGSTLRDADAPLHGGFRGYIADPDGHAWEIAWNPAWTIDERGLVTFGA